MAFASFLACSSDLDSRAPFNESKDGMVLHLPISWVAMFHTLGQAKPMTMPRYSNDSAGSEGPSSSSVGSTLRGGAAVVVVEASSGDGSASSLAKCAAKVFSHFFSFLVLYSGCRDTTGG